MRPIFAEGDGGFIIFVIIVALSIIGNIVRKLKESSRKLPPPSSVGQRPPQREAGKSITLREFLSELGEQGAKPTVPQPPPQPMAPPRPVAPPRPTVPRQPTVLSGGPMPPPPPIRPQRPVARSVQQFNEAAKIAPDLGAEKLMESIEEQIEDTADFSTQLEKVEEQIAATTAPMTAKPASPALNAYSLKDLSATTGIGLSPKTARRAIVLMEILQPPLAMRRRRIGGQRAG